MGHECCEMYHWTFPYHIQFPASIYCMAQSSHVVCLARQDHLRGKLFRTPVGFEHSLASCILTRLFCRLNFYRNVNNRYLLEGVCVAETDCELAGLVGVGSGNFNRRCEVPPTAAASTTLKPSATTCIGKVFNIAAFVFLFFIFSFLGVEYIPVLSTSAYSLQIFKKADPPT
jgi:hypothetical protein